MAITDKRIVYNNDSGYAVIIVPSSEWTGTADELASLVVPSGKTYSIIDSSAIPTDRENRDNWKVADDFSINTTTNIKAKRLTVLNATYEDKFTKLQLSYPGADLSDGTNVDTKHSALVTQYATLMTEKTTKRSAILSG